MCNLCQKGLKSIDEGERVINGLEWIIGMEYNYFHCRSTWFIFMFNYSITDHMDSYDLHETLGLISKNLSVFRVVICLF